MSSAHPKYRPHIDGLRAVAVMAVIGFHAFPNAVPGGFMGVDVFFVISGFLMSQILFGDFSSGMKSGFTVIAEFYGRRVRRIFPALIVVLLACYAYGYMTLLPVEFGKLALHVAAGAGFIINLLFSRETGYFDDAATSSPLLHLWSLGVEEQFYFLWPVVIWLLTRCRIKALPTVVFLAACSFFWNAGNSPTSASVAFFLPQMRLWELLVGAVAALSFKALRGPKDGRPLVLRPIFENSLAVLGLVLIAIGFVRARSDLEIPNRWMLVTTLGAGMSVFTGEGAWVNRYVLSQRTLVWIGLISYPLYLWHWPLLVFSGLASSNAGSALEKTGVILLSVVLAWLTYRFIETPVRRSRITAKKTILAVISMALVTALGYSTYREKGFPSRFPRIVRELSDWNYDSVGPWRDGSYFLRLSQDETSFPKDPLEIDRNKPTIYLWGDSHAASLYPGMKSVYEMRFNVVQRTAAGVPPFMGSRFNLRSGASINRFIFDSIKRDQPDYVFLYAHWLQYDWRYVEETVAALKAAGIRHVVVVGPIPEWANSLPQTLFDYIKAHPSAPVPLRLKSGVSPQALILDREMAAMSARIGAQYISLCKLLQNQDGFLTRTGETADSLVEFDHAHLTVLGARYLVSQFPAISSSQGGP